MFAKYSKISLIFKPNLAFSTFPVTFKYFKNPKNPDSRFAIRQLLPSEIPEVSASIAEVYYTRENVIRTLNIPRDQFSESIQKELKIAQENDLAIICRDEKSNKLAGAIYCEDLRVNIDEKTLGAEQVFSDDKWMQYEDFYKFCFLYVDKFAMPKGLNDILHCKRIAVSKEYSQLTVGNNIMYAARFLHPKMTKANRVLIIATHEYTYNFCKLNGFELIKKISYKSIRDRQNKKPFEHMKKLDNRTEADEFVYVMKREHEGKNPLHEIKQKK